MLKFIFLISENQLPEIVGLNNFVDILFKIIIPLVLTFLFSGFMGLERQNMGKAAGISSHILVAVSSAALAIMQRLMMEYELSVSTNFQGQRVIAQVVTGIGFIGAGVIMKDKFTVKGLTTAATIWTTAMIGLILGSGYLLIGSSLGLVVSLFTLIRDFRRGINPFRPYHTASHAAKRYRFLSKDEQTKLIEEEFFDEELPHL